ncbi:hypothetical protein [Synechococcus sp. PCC 6312]|uniref:hypothetical protein n=1 Tax=Synechococcus sp. (strain ATCC 27167 / PCC 6312) TaxID=195253 RepID=UPI00029F3E29|nr:hypothetical protein [Synechococcus sp. PCC 6312]AFY62088.1 hypothetical protein Syn6312_3034 [Synechococcus sp. PCC 6312]
MAAAHITTSTTLEGQILELARVAQLAELAVPEEDRPDNITIQPDFEEQTVSLRVTLPIMISGAGGELTIEADEYLP